MAETVEPIIKSSGISWEDFQDSTQWKRLTPLQQVWFVNFCASGDAVFATRAAFHCSSEVNVRNMARQTEHSPRVAAALNLYRGKSPREIFLKQLKAKIDACEDGSIAQAKNLALYARLAFDVVAPDEPDESGKKSPAKAGRFKVGDPVLINGEKRRVLAIDEHGEPTDVSDEVIK